MPARSTVSFLVSILILIMAAFWLYRPVPLEPIPPPPPIAAEEASILPTTTAPTHPLRAGAVVRPARP